MAYEVNNKEINSQCAELLVRPTYKKWYMSNVIIYYVAHKNKLIHVPHISTSYYTCHIYPQVTTRVTYIHKLLHVLALTTSYYTC